MERRESGMGTPAKNSDWREKEGEKKSMKKRKSEDPGRRKGGRGKECSVNGLSPAVNVL